MKLYLIRHGQTEANINGVFCGSSDLGLTELGVSQAQHVARQLAAIPLDAILHTDLARSRDTAKYIAEGRDTALQTQPLMQEMCFGDWELRHHNELQASEAEGYALWCQDWQAAMCLRANRLLSLPSVFGKQCASFIKCRQKAVWRLSRTKAR